MKNLIFMLALLSILSCSKIVNDEISVIEINNNKFYVENDYLVFDNFDNFYKVIADYYKNEQDYIVYFETHTHQS